VIEGAYPLRPKTTLAEVYGAGRLYSPRVSDNAGTWLPHDRAVLDAFTGGQLTMAGDMPVLCAAGVSTTEGLAMIRDAGFPIASSISRITEEADYWSLLQPWDTGNGEVVVVHRQPADELAPESCWVPPDILSFVNNKSNLSMLVEDGLVPQRRLVKVGRLVAEIGAEELPVVLKAVTEESTGGGYDVLICDDPRILSEADIHFASCEEVVVEEFISIDRNLCMNYAVSSEGAVTYLGSAEQVSAADGSYQGNWIDAGSEPPAEVVEAGARTVSAGYRRGYWGLVGIDAAVQDDGRAWFFDLNFRANGCTSALMLAPGLRTDPEREVLRYRAFFTQGDFLDLLRAVSRAIEEGLYLPLSLYDPSADGHAPSPARMNGVVPGGSREEIAEKILRLGDLGLA